jgi:putative FmdB family regulatory protein
VNPTVPIYEYQCCDCGEQFEYLVRGDDKAVCPSCGSRKLDKQISAAATHMAGSGGASCPARDMGVCRDSHCHGGGCGCH